MLEKHTSEKLLRELPRPVAHFMWYLWETYSDPNVSEFHITLHGHEDPAHQRFIIHTIGKTIAKDFRCNIDADIAIRKSGARCFMEYN